MTEPGLEAAFLHFVGRTGDLEWCGFMDLENVRWFWNEATKAEQERCCDAIQASCGMCDGKGYCEAPDGERAGCDYCGYPIAAIREQEASDDV